MATQRAYERRILRPMSTIGDKYLLGSGRTDHDRLRVISEIHDGRTRELLRKAGFVAGHRFVEFSCGLGYVTRWAASEGAHATGIDLNEDHLTVAAELAHEAGLKTAEFRSANIYEPGLEPDSVDLSYSRWLMVHLNRPVDAMRAIHETLKPGGVMVCEEADVSAVYAKPPSTAYNELRDICMEGARQRGVDYSGGRRVHLWAREAGFEIVQCLSSALRYWQTQGILELDIARCRSRNGERRKFDRRAAGRASCRNEQGRCFTRHTGCALPDAPANREEA